MSLLDRDALMCADRLAVVDIDLPELGGTVRLREMSGADSEAYFDWIQQHRSTVGGGIRAAALVFSAIDADGNRLLGVDDIDQINRTWPYRILDRLFDEHEKLNAVSKDDLESAEKNSAKTQSADSSAD